MFDVTKVPYNIEAHTTYTTCIYVQKMVNPSFTN